MNIVEVIKSFVELKESGVYLIGNCPLRNHEDNVCSVDKCPIKKHKKGSFVVSPLKNIFYCFGCHVGSTPEDFLRLINIDKVTTNDKVESA